MFLKPMKTAKGKKPLLIIDFVTNIVPQEEEETLGNQGSAKIVVTYGPKKPKLEFISIPQWVVANTRIFYTLLPESKLSTQSAIQDYLAYTVEIMELIARYDWKSILMYDNEFRKLQAIYKFSWSFDSTHLHTVSLQPIINLIHPQPLLNHLLLIPTSATPLPALRQMVGLSHSQIVILPMSVIVRLQGRLVPCLTPGSLTKLPTLQVRKDRNDYPYVN